MKKLLIATTNPGKYEEIRRFLSDLSLMLISLRDLHIHQDVVEDGKTFEENATKKAKFFSKISNLPTVADDGGIEIDYLHGMPGVNSRRWAGQENTLRHDQESDERLIQFTLTKLKGVPKNKRGARMRTVVSFALPGGATYTAEGIIRGIIAQKPSTGRYLGFPFRSLFYLPQVHKFYNHDELTIKENEAYNHRKRALEQLKPIIKKLLS